MHPLLRPPFHIHVLANFPGHYKHYVDDMFMFKTGEGQEFGLKPMNCPGHCLMVSRLPLKWAIKVAINWFPLPHPQPRREHD